MTIQMKPLQQYFCMVPFVFFNILQNGICFFCLILMFGTPGSYKGLKKKLLHMCTSTPYKSGNKLISVMSPHYKACSPFLHNKTLKVV